MAAVLSRLTIGQILAGFSISAKTFPPPIWLCTPRHLASSRKKSLPINNLEMLGSKNIGSVKGPKVLADVNTNNSSYHHAKNSEPKKHFTIAVEGNIGSGKTTLLEYFKDSPNVEAIREPIEQWTDVQGHNALELLYQDPSRWSFSFNMYATLTRVQMHTKPPTKPVKMLERTLHSTRYCFVENDYRNKTINGLEYSIITEWFNWLVKSQDIHIDRIVYLRATPEKCYERIKKRDRKEESSVPIKLIEDLHNLHEEWLIDQSGFKAPAPVLVIDANQEYEDIVKEYEHKRQNILCGFS